MNTRNQVVDKLYHFIGGARSEGENECYGPVYTPSTGEKTAICPYASAGEVNIAVEAAEQVFKGWK